MSGSIDHAAIAYRLSMIDRELAAVDPLLRTVSRRPPDPVEIRAVGSVFQAFYNGIESVLALLLPAVAAGGDWHQRLLETAQEQGLLDESLFLRLDQFRRFRHKYRHAYGFMLDWEMMAPLHAMLAAVYQDFQAVVRRYSPPADAG